MMVVSAILNVLWYILKFILIPVAIFVVLVISIKSICEFRKYGFHIFSAFKTKDISNARDELLRISLDKITWYKKIVRVPYLNSNYILLDGNGVTIFKVFTKVGNFDGTSSSKYLYYRSNGREYRITNPVLCLNADAKIIKKVLPDVNINKCLVLTEGTYINPLDGINQISFNKLPYGLIEGHKYMHSEIDDMENKLM